MSKLPRNIKPQKLINLLIKLGIELGKGKGSHVRLTHPDGRWTQVAVHPRPIPQGTLRKIINQAELTKQELESIK